MVSKKQAFQASAISSAVIGLIYWIAQNVFGNGPESVIPVGLTIIIGTFLVAYFGMVNN
jgi:xanthine/uracil permease